MCILLPVDFIRFVGSSWSGSVWSTARWNPNSCLFCLILLHCLWWPEISLWSWRDVEIQLLTNFLYLCRDSFVNVVIHWFIHWFKRTTFFDSFVWFIHVCMHSFNHLILLSIISMGICHLLVKNTNISSTPPPPLPHSPLPPCTPSPFSVSLYLSVSLSLSICIISLSL